jgi:four helix bundle protein
MDTPLLQKTYAFAVTAARWHRARIAMDSVTDLEENFVRSTLGAGARIEEATGATTRAEFLERLRQADLLVRDAKYWLRLLDDLDDIGPDDATELHDAAEEAHRLILACIKTVKTGT